MRGDAYMAITALMERLAEEGVDRWYLSGIEQALTNKVAKAQKEARAEHMLQLFGADETARVLELSRATVYNIVHRRRRRRHFESSLISKSD
jgi:DNA-directed RNA polymerase specialized sigma24 family protein